MLDDQLEMVLDQYMSGFVPQPDLQRLLRLIIKLTLLVTCQNANSLRH